MNPSNPGETEKPVDPSIKPDGSTITITATTVQEINDFLADKDNAQKPVAETIKKNEEITFVIDSKNLEVTKAETIKLPALEDKTVNVIFSDPLKKHTAELEILDNSLDVLTITLPATFGKLKIHADYSVVTLAGNSTIDQLALDVNKTNNNDRVMTISNGITVKSIKYVKDRVVVEDGATIVAVLVDGDYVSTNSNYSAYIYNDGTVYAGSIINEKGNTIYLENIDITGDAAIYVGAAQKTPFGKITVAEGKTLTVSGNQYVGEIVGLGAKGATLKNSNLQRIQAINNMVIEGNVDTWVDDNGDTQLSYQWPTISTQLTKCTLNNYGGVYFPATMNAIKDVKMTTTSERFYVYHYVPKKGESTSYTFNIENCEFPANTYFSSLFNDQDNIYDADGEPVKYPIYYWDEYDENGNWVATKSSKNLKDVPVEVRKENRYWQNTFEPKVNVSYKGFDAITAIKNSKRGGAAISAENFSGAPTTSTGATLKYEINGKLYGYVWSDTNGYVLVTVK